MLGQVTVSRITGEVRADPMADPLRSDPRFRATPRDDRRALNSPAKRRAHGRSPAGREALRVRLIELLVLDHHLRGNSSVVRWPQPARRSRGWILAEQRNVLHFGISLGQNQVDALIEL
jgi:hypothetical protein